MKTTSSTATTATNDPSVKFNLLMNFGVDFFEGYFLAEFFHPTELISSFTLLNRRMRKCILQSSKLWKRQFELMYPNLMDLVNDWINCKLWNDERGERLSSFLTEDPTFQFQPYFSAARNCNENDAKIVETSCKSQMVHFLSLIILDHSFYETNFNSEYTWNANYRSDFKYHQVNYPIHFKLFKFFYLLIDSKRLVRGSDIYIKNVMNKLHPKHCSRKLYKQLLMDMVFKSSFPCSAVFYLSSGYSDTNRYLREEEEGIDHLPCIDFGFETGWNDPSFRIYPYIKYNTSTTNTGNNASLHGNQNHHITEFNCTVVFQVQSVSQTYEFVYPQDFNKILNLFERFCATNECIFFGASVDSNEMGRLFGLGDFILEKTNRVQSKHYVRKNCVGVALSLRVYFQSQVDKYARQIVKSIGGCNGGGGSLIQSKERDRLLCSHLAQYPSKLEIDHLLAGEDVSLLETIPNEFAMYKDSFIKQRKKILETCRDGFEIDDLLIRSVDKCLRRYLHLIVFSQPTLIESTQHCTVQSLQRVAYKQLRNLTFSIFILLIPQISKLITLRLETCLNNEEIQSSNKFNNAQQEIYTFFEQLNFTNKPIIDFK